VYKQQGKLDDAARELREAIRLRPDAADAYSTLAGVLRQLGDDAGASEAAKRAATITREKTSLQAATFATNAGKQSLRAGQIEKAIAQFEQAIKSMPAYAPAHYQLGLALRKKGDATRAHAAFQKAEELDPRIKAPRF
jgi:tetratricopeptide (TPR) repeat protein